MSRITELRSLSRSRRERKTKGSRSLSISLNSASKAIEGPKIGTEADGLEQQIEQNLIRMQTVGTYYFIIIKRKFSILTQQQNCLRDEIEALKMEYKDRQNLQLKVKELEIRIQSSKRKQNNAIMSLNTILGDLNNLKNEISSFRMLSRVKGFNDQIRSKTLRITNRKVSETYRGISMNNQTISNESANG